MGIRIDVWMLATLVVLSALAVLLLLLVARMSAARGIIDGARLAYQKARGIVDWFTRDIMDVRDSAGGTYAKRDNWDSDGGGGEGLQMDSRYQMGRYKLAFMALASIGLLTLAACNFIKVTGGDQNQGQGQEVAGPTPEASPSTSPQCTLTAIAPGTENDSRTVPQGGEREIGVSLLGPQGLELVATCRSQHVATWIVVSGPCTVSADSSGAGAVFAPLSAPVDSTCKLRVNVGSLSAPLHDLRVVAAATLHARYGLDEPDPQPSPTPTPDPDLGFIDR